MTTELIIGDAILTPPAIRSAVTRRIMFHAPDRRLESFANQSQRQGCSCDRGTGSLLGHSRSGAYDTTSTLAKIVSLISQHLPLIGHDRVFAEDIRTLALIQSEDLVREYDVERDIPIAAPLT